MNLSMHPLWLLVVHRVIEDFLNNILTYVLYITFLLTKNVSSGYIYIMYMMIAVANIYYKNCHFGGKYLNFIFFKYTVYHCRHNSLLFHTT